MSTARRAGRPAAHDDQWLIEHVARMRTLDPQMPKEQAYRRAVALLPERQRASAVGRLRKAQRQIDAAWREVAARTREAQKLLAAGFLREALASGYAHLTPYGVYVGPTLPSLLSETEFSRELPVMTPKIRRSLAAKVSAVELAAILKNIAHDLEAGRLNASDQVRDAIAALTEHAFAALE